MSKIKSENSPKFRPQRHDRSAISELLLADRRVLEGGPVGVGDDVEGVEGPRGQCWGWDDSGMAVVGAERFADFPTKSTIDRQRKGTILRMSEFLHSN